MYKIKKKYVILQNEIIILKMKKVVLILVIAFTLGVVMSSCSLFSKSSKSKNCAAYGEYKKFQKENVY